MKKLFTFAMLLMFVIDIGAQEKKEWNFENGLSEETVANLKADKTNWADNGTDASTGEVNNWQNSTKQSATSYWMANGQVIEELRGLLIDIGSNSSNSIHLAQNKVRLTRKSTKITFPKLANGQTIKIVGRSANGTATNRGIAPTKDYLKFQAEESSPLYGGQCIFVGNQVDGSEGTYTFVWKVETDSPDSVEVQFQLTPDAGIDFTLFQIDKGDAPGVEGPQPVAYLYSGDNSSDYAYAFLAGDSRFNLTEIDVANTTANADSLRKFQAVVISPTIAATDSYVSTLKDVVAFVPTLNLNTAIYEALGYGKAVQSNTNMLTVQTENETLFEGLDITDGIELLQDGAITGVELGDYFANDDIIATAGDVVAMHMHNAKRNAYLLLPLSIEDMLVTNEDMFTTLIPQALQTVLETKKDVAAVGTPSITPTQNNGYTTVAITAANSTAIYYTLDGNEPTIESTLYTEPFTLTAAATVKALAIGDGYLDSQIASKDIIIKVNAEMPEISVASEDGKATVTINSASEGTTVYYNFTGSTVLTEAAIYSEPIELSQPATIYAFAVGGDYLNSEVNRQFVEVTGINADNVRWDVMAHFDANSTNWKGKGQQTDETGTIVNANYFFTWGKDAGQYWDETSATIVKGSDGVTDSIVYTRTLEPETYKPEDENWIIKSIGQVMTWESLDTKYNIGDTSYRNPDSAEDVIGVNDTDGWTRDAITFGKQPSGGPFNASLESTVKYQAPFDVVVYAGNGNNGETPTMQIETSADGENWTKLGDVNFSLIQRNWKKTVLSYEGTGEVYVRLLHTAAKSSGQIYDLYVMNHGDESAQKYQDVVTGIINIETAPAGEVVRTEIFSLGGTRMQNAGRGISIVRQTYENGVVVTKKVIKK